MGYSYGRSSSGRMSLACDACPALGARKRKCPSGWCQAPALCGPCFKTVKADGRWAKAHEGCPARSAAFKAEQQKRADVIAGGGFVRCSALTIDETAVRVIFQGATGDVGFNMTPETYHALPYGVVATPDDYRKFGTLTSAPADFAFYFGDARQTKEVA